MRGILCRGLRLELVAGLGLALAMPAFAAPLPATTTTLTTQSSTGSCPTANLSVTLTTLSVSVTSTAGVPAGTVSIVDGTGSGQVQLASATLDATGKASLELYLADGSHSLSAVYSANTTLSGSTSTSVPVAISSQCDSAFVVTVSNLTPANTLTAGQTGTAVVTVVPSQDFVTSLGSAPGFITLSCSGLPDQSSCGFTPANLEIPSGQSAGVVSTMLIDTYAASTTKISPATRPGKSSTPIAWAFLLPGTLGFGGLAWGVRRREWLRRLSLVALVAVVTLLGATGCNPRYNYENHGPVPNPATPAGTYTVKVIGQFSNGVTATTNSTTMTLTVN